MILRETDIVGTLIQKRTMTLSEILEFYNLKDKSNIRNILDHLVSHKIVIKSGSQGITIQYSINKSGAEKYLSCKINEREGEIQLLKAFLSELEP